MNTVSANTKSKQVHSMHDVTILDWYEQSKVNLKISWCHVGYLSSNFLEVCISFFIDLWVQCLEHRLSIEIKIVAWTAACVSSPVEMVYQEECFLEVPRLSIQAVDMQFTCIIIDNHTRWLGKASEKNLHEREFLEIHIVP